MVVLATGRPFHATIDIYNELDLSTVITVIIIMVY